VTCAPQDGLHVALSEQGTGPQLGGGLEAALLEGHAVDAEITQLGLVGEVDQPRAIADACLAQLVVHVEHVLERRPLAGAGAVPHAHHQGLLLAGLQPFDGGAQRGRRLDGVVGRADADGVPAVRAETGGGPELQLRPGGVDQVVVADPFALPGGGRGGVLHVDGALAGQLVATGPDGGGLGLDEPDALLLVDGRKREHHLFLLHLAHAHPDVAGDPVPLRVRRHHRDGVAARQQAGQVQGGGVAGNAGPENHDVSHLNSFVVTAPFSLSPPDRRRSRGSATARPGRGRRAYCRFKDGPAIGPAATTPPIPCLAARSQKETAMPHTTATVGSAIGLKARPASIIADAVAELGIPMTLRLDGRDTPTFDATSSMEIAKLGAGPGASVIVESDDEDANAAIASLIESDLDEE